MKRPLVVITAGFVLGEVLALCLQEAVYRIFFWFAGVLFLTVLAVRRFLSRSVMSQDASAYFCVCFWRDDGRKFFRRQVPGTDGAGRKEDYPGRIWGCGAADRPGSGCTGKK